MLTEEAVALVRQHRFEPWVTVGAVSGGLVIAGVAFFVSWKLVSPGASLMVPCVAVAAFVLVALAAGLVILVPFGSPRAIVSYVLVAGLFGMAVIWWTWAFSLSAPMAWDSGATPHTLAALAKAPTHSSRCVVVTTGGIGPLRAPYQECAIGPSHAGTVHFYAMSGGSVVSPSRGLVFDEGPASFLSDECARHLVGRWYAFTGDPAGGTGYDQCFGGA